MIALTGCSLFDGRQPSIQQEMTVVIDGDKIVEVSPGREFGDDVRVTDVQGRTVMPGLIDCHVHFALWSLFLLDHSDRSISYQVAQSIQDLRKALEAGCTGARDPGGLDSGLRDAVHDGLVTGPRLQTSVTIVSPVNGVADSTNKLGIIPPSLPGMPSPWCSGPHEARTKVREVLRAGGDFIKIATTGGVNSPLVHPTQSLFTQEEVEAIVSEAHAWGVPVICHALGGPGVLTAVRAGVDTIEHGGWLDESCVREMADRGTWLVPTFAEYDWHAMYGSELKQERARRMRESHFESFRMAREAGVRVAMGSDGGAYVHDFTYELELLVEAGMSPGEALLAGTAQAADCLGWADEVGTIEPDKQADLLVVSGDPTSDVRVLRDASSLDCVMKGGDAVVDRLDIAGRPTAVEGE